VSAVVLAALMWAVVLSSAFPLRRGRDRSVLVAAALMATSFTVTVPGVYRAIDEVTGWPNVADLVKHTLFVLAVTALWAGIGTALGVRAVPRAVLRVAPVVVVAAQTAAFLAIDQGDVTTTAFMPAHGDQPAAAIYSIAHFAYFGAGMAATGTACLRSGLTSMPTALRGGVLVLLAGCGASVATAVLLVVRDLVRLAGATSTADALERAYAPMLLVSVVLVALGLALPRLLAAAARRRLARELPGLTERLEGLRSRAVGRAASQRLPRGAALPGGGATPLDALHRLVVEVRDALFLDPTLVPTDDEGKALERAERLVGRLELL